jgi:hypothetical protein
VRYFSIICVIVLHNVEYLCRIKLINLQPSTTTNFEYPFNTFIKYMTFNARGRSVRPKHVAGVDGLKKLVVFDGLGLSISNIIWNNGMNYTKK